MFATVIFISFYHLIVNMQGDEIVTLDDAVEKVLTRYKYHRIKTNPRTYERLDYRNSTIEYTGKELCLTFSDKKENFINQIRFVNNTISVSVFFTYPQYLARKASEIGPEYNLLRRIAVYSASSGADIVENEISHQETHDLMCQLIDYEDQAAIASKG